MEDGGDTRTCPRCGERTAADGFAWRNRSAGQRAPYCRACQAAYGRAHYAANRALYIARAEASKRRYRQQRTAQLLEYFATHPCVDCGETDPVVLEFDHLRDKRFEIGSDMSYRSWSTILAEIEKCEVVCCNCHRRRTSTRMGALRVLLSQAASEAGDGN